MGDKKEQRQEELTALTVEQKKAYVPPQLARVETIPIMAGSWNW